MTIAQKLRIAQSGEVDQIKDFFSIDFYQGRNGTQGNFYLHNNLDFNSSRASIWFKDYTSNASWASYSEANGSSQNVLAFDTDAYKVSIGNTIFVGDSLPSAGTYGIHVKDNLNRVSQTNYNFISYALLNKDRFFKEITYTGNGTNQKLNYDLKDTLGMAFFKNVTTGGNWFVWHRQGGTYQSSGNYYHKLGFLNTTDPFEDSGQRFNGNTTSGQYGTVDTSAETFWIGPGNNNNLNRINNNGDTHIAMFFAHNTSSDPDQNFIKCDSFNTGSHNGIQVDVGFEPQFLMVKRKDFVNSDWYIIDKFSGACAGGGIGQNARFPRFNTNSSPHYITGIILNGSGFYIRPNSDMLGGADSNREYIYMAIKADNDLRSEKPQRHFFGWTYQNTFSNANQQNINPVFYKGNASNLLPSGSSGDVNMTPDNAIIYDIGTNTGAAQNGQLKMMFSNKTAEKGFATNNKFNNSPSPIYDLYASNNPAWFTNGFGNTSTYGTNADTSFQAYMWKNTKGVADCQVYKPQLNGQTPGSTVTIKHNLGVPPEMMIFKKINSNSDFWVYHKDMLGPSETGVSKGHYFTKLNQAASNGDTIGGQPWGSDGMTIGGYPTAPTATEIKLNGNAYNASYDTLVDYSHDYVVWMFASKRTVCHVGKMHIQYGYTSYTSSLADFPSGCKLFFMYRKIGYDSFGTFTPSTAAWRVVSTDFEFDHNFGFNHDKYMRLHDTLPAVTDENICSNTGNRAGINPNIGNEGNGYYIYLVIAYTE